MPRKSVCDSKSGTDSGHLWLNNYGVKIDAQAFYANKKSI